jgi:hypothetical protein
MDFSGDVQETSQNMRSYFPSTDREYEFSSLAKLAVGSELG